MHFSKKNMLNYVGIFPVHTEFQQEVGFKHALLEISGNQRHP